MVPYAQNSQRSIMALPAGKNGMWRKIMKYDPALREAILRRILPPNSEPMSKVARDSRISLQTLFNWKKNRLLLMVFLSQKRRKAKSFPPKKNFAWLLNLRP